MTTNAPRCPGSSRLRLALALGLALANLPVPAAAQRAQAPTDLSALSLEQLMDIEVQSVFGASRYLQRITEAPASVTIVTADEIRRHGYRTLGDALRMVRGLYVSSDRQYAFAGLRGFQRPGNYNTHLLLLVDGHRLNDNLFDSVGLDDTAPVDIEDVERIEVIRGPSSSLYGSNAFLGVVNLVMRRGRDVKGVEATLESGSFGRLGARVAWGTAFGSTGGFSISASTSDTDGPERLYFPHYDAPATNHGVSVGLDFVERKTVRARLDLGGFAVQAGWNQRTKGIPTAAYGIVFNDPRALVEDALGYFDASWERKWSPELSTNVRAFLDRYDYGGVFPFDYGTPEEPFVVENRDDSVGQWGGVEARVSRSWRRHRVTAGFEYRSNFDLTQRNYDVDPPFSYLDDHRQSTTIGLFAQDDIRLSSLFTASLGLRHDRYSGFKDPLKPRLGLIATPSSRRTFKLLYGEAFRAPNAYEMYYGWDAYIPNERLRAEDARTVELVWEEYLGRNYRLGANLYDYRIRDLISQVETPAGLLMYDNAENASARGLELEAEGKWAAGFQARASYAWQRARDAVSGAELTNSPRHLAQAVLSAPLGEPGAFASLTLRCVGSRLGKDGARVPGYAVPGLTLVSPLLSTQLSAQFVVDNLFDRAYSDPVSEELSQIVVPQDGRTWLLKVSWRFR